MSRISSYYRITQNGLLYINIDQYTKVFQLVTQTPRMKPESRQLFNVHNLCIVKHASNVSYMRANGFFHRHRPTHRPTHTDPQRQTNRGRPTEADPQRQIHRDRYTQTHRDRYTQTHRDRPTETDTHRPTETDPQTQTHTHTPTHTHQHTHTHTLTHTQQRRALPKITTIRPFK